MSEVKQVAKDPIPHGKHQLIALYQFDELTTRAQSRVIHRAKNHLQLPGQLLLEIRDSTDDEQVYQKLHTAGFCNTRRSGVWIVAHHLSETR